MHLGRNGEAYFAEPEAAPAAAAAAGGGGAAGGADGDLGSADACAASASAAAENEDDAEALFVTELDAALPAEAEAAGATAEQQSLVRHAFFRSVPQSRNTQQTALFLCALTHARALPAQPPGCAHGRRGAGARAQRH